MHDVALRAASSHWRIRHAGTLQMLGAGRARIQRRSAEAHLPRMRVSQSDGLLLEFGKRYARGTRRARDLVTREESCRTNRSSITTFPSMRLLARATGTRPIATVSGSAGRRRRIRLTK